MSGVPKISSRASKRAAGRRWLIAAGVSLALATSGWALYRLVNSRTFQFFGDIVASVPCTAPVVALTLDDGPTPDGTARLLELLARHGVRATFFLTGAALEQFPDAGRRIAAAGHQLGNHGYSHSRMLLKSSSFIREEVESTDARIRAAGFEGEILFRPPFGKKLLGLPWYLRSTRRTTVMWSIEPESTPGVEQTPEGLAAHVLSSVEPGAIVLLHAMTDPYGEKQRALELIIEGLHQRGYRLATLNEMRGGACTG